MLKFAMVIGVVAGFFPVQDNALLAQDIKIRVEGKGTVEVAPPAAPAPREIEAPLPDYRKDSAAMDEAMRRIRDQARIEGMLLADGDAITVGAPRAAFARRTRSPPSTARGESHRVRGTDRLARTAPDRRTVGPTTDIATP